MVQPQLFAGFFQAFFKASCHTALGSTNRCRDCFGYEFTEEVLVVVLLKGEQANVKSLEVFDHRILSCIGSPLTNFGRTRQGLNHTPRLGMLVVQAVYVFAYALERVVGNQHAFHLHLEIPHVLVPAEKQRMALSASRGVYEQGPRASPATDLSVRSWALPNRFRADLGCPEALVSFCASVRKRENQSPTCDLDAYRGGLATRRLIRPPAAHQQHVNVAGHKRLDARNMPTRANREQSGQNRAKKYFFGQKAKAKKWPCPSIFFVDTCTRDARSRR